METLDQIDDEIKHESNEVKTIDETFSETENIQDKTIKTLINIINKIKAQITNSTTRDEKEIKNEFTLIDDYEELNKLEKHLNELAKQEEIETEYINELYNLIQIYGDHIDLNNLKALQCNSELHYEEKNNIKTYNETNQSYLNKSSKEILNSLIQSPQIFTHNHWSRITSNNNENQLLNEIEKNSILTNCIPINTEKLNLKKENIQTEIFLYKDLPTDDSNLTILRKISEIISNKNGRNTLGWIKTEDSSTLENNKHSEEESFHSKFNSFSSAIIGELQIWPIEQKENEEWIKYYSATINFNIYTPINE